MRRPSLPRPSLPKAKLPKRRKKPLTPQQAALKPAAPKPATPAPQAAAPAPRSAIKAKLAGKRPPLKLLLPALGAIIVVVLLLGTCGSDDDKKVRETLNRFAQASREKDYQALCDDLLSQALVAQLRTADQPCEVVFRIGLSEVQNPTLEVLSVKVNGDEATAQVDSVASGQPPLKTKVLLKREDGEWRIASLPGEKPSAPTP